MVWLFVLDFGGNVTPAVMASLQHCTEKRTSSYFPMIAWEGSKTAMINQEEIISMPIYKWVLILKGPNLTIGEKIRQEKQTPKPHDDEWTREKNVHKICGLVKLLHPVCQSGPTLGQRSGLNQIWTGVIISVIWAPYLCNLHCTDHYMSNKEIH